MSYLSARGVGVLIGMLAGSVLTAQAKDLVKVNNRALTDTDLEVSLSGFNEGQREKILKDPALRTQMLESLVDQEIMVQEAESMKLQTTPEFKQALALYGRQLLADMLVRKQVASKLTSAEVRKYYQLNQSRYSTAQARALHILLPTEEEARKIMKVAEAPGADFQALAEKYSKDPAAKNNRGDLGFFGRDQLAAEFTQAVFTAKLGAVVGPVRTAFGFHIIKVLSRDPGKVLGFDEVEVKVRGALQQERVQSFVLGLRQKAKVTFEK